MPDASDTRAPSARELWVCDLGLVDYDEALGLQRAVARARITGEIAEDVLLLCEHPPIVTLGRSSKPGHLLLSEAALAERGIALREVERGGDVTLHAPGQLVGYPVIDLKRHTQDLHWYLRRVEQGLIDAMGALGIAAGRRDGLTGVWVADRKLASIGVHARDWVTWHGFALNVTTDLSLFEVMVPCGIAGVAMTSVTAELRAAAPAAPVVRSAVVDGVAAVFGLAPVRVGRGGLAVSV
ncbi:MAG: lipoyl(octanoyl) transferase LipB [Gemmatimonadaceae bacterium]|jgi:lipoyl(octanoyl) transferase|nr:lipoyl(octanoyl) transferase LipB [Gemmatimonadaceae bacterium]